MISSTDRDILQFLGFSVLSDLAGFTMSTILYGMFAFLFAHATATFVQRRSKAHGTRVMFGLTIVSFLLATVYWSASWVYLLGYVRWGVVDHINGRLSNYWLDDLFRSVFIPYQVQLCVIQVMQIINDIIVIWRAWVLWDGRRSLLIGPMVLLLGMFATVFSYLVIRGTEQGSAHDILSGLPLALFVSGACLSVATNVVSIILIGLRFWAHRKAWTFSMGRRRSSRSQNILLLIIESGCVYCALQLAVLIITAYTSLYDSLFVGMFAPIVFEFYVQTTAMYPTVVLILINQKRSIVDIHVVRISASHKEGTE